MVGRLFLRQNQGHMTQIYIRNEGMMTSNLRKLIFLLSLLFFSFSLFAQPSADAGKTLFRNYCAQCHSKDMKTRSTGPALGGIEERWVDYPQEDLYSWIRNSGAMINVVKHPRAVELWDCRWWCADTRGTVRLVVLDLICSIGSIVIDPIEDHRQPRSACSY